MLDLDCLGSQFFFFVGSVEVGVGVEICLVMLSSEGLLNIPGGNSGIIYHKQLCILIEFSFETRLCYLCIRFVKHRAFTLLLHFDRLQHHIFSLHISVV